MSVEEGERARNIQAAERHREQLRRLAASALLINSTVEIDELLAVITKQARETIGAHRAVTSLTTENGSQAVTNVAATDAHAAWRDSGAPLAAAELLDIVCRENRPFRLTRNGRGSPGGWLAAPLVSRDGRNLGVIQLAAKEEGEFDDEDEAILVQLAQMASAALENVRLYDDARRRADELDALHRLAEAVAVARGLDEVFEVALDALEQALGVDRGSVVLFEDGGVIRFRAWRNLSERYRRAIQGRAPWKRQSDDPSPFVVDDVLADAEVAELHEAFRAEGIRSMALVPLVHAGVILGRFVLYADRPAAFATNDIRLAGSMASHVAAAVERRRAVDELVESRNQLATIFASVADGITAQDAAGRLVFANDAAAQLCGFSTAEELLAASTEEIVSRFELLDEDGAPLDLDRLPGRVALATGREAEHLVCYRLRDSGDRRWSIVRATPLVDAAGRVELAINVFHDVTEPKQAEQRLRLLTEASAALAGSLDVGAALGAVARLVVPELADFCLVDVLDDDGSAREVVGVHVDPDGRQALAALRAHFPVDAPGHPVADVVRTGEPLLLLDGAGGVLESLARDDTHRDLYRELGATSFLVVPLTARGRTLGAVTLGTSSSGRRLIDADAAVVVELAERAALALDNARLFGEAQAEVAERQRSEERLRFLGRASQVLAGTLDYEKTLAGVARLAVPHVADWCIVYERRPDGTINRLAVEHAGGAAEQVRAVLDRHPLDPDAPEGVPAVLRSGEPRLVVEETAGRLSADVDDPASLVAELAEIVPTSSICAPLIARGRTIGAIALMTAESGRRYGPEDLELAVELARRAAVAVDNALLYREARQSLAQLEAVLVSAPVGIGFWDRELRYVRVNDALAEINGIPPEEHVGRSLREVIPELAEQVEPLYRRVLETGEPVIHHETTSAAAAAPGDERHWLSSYFPVRTQDGETTGVGAVIMDVTDRERAQARLRFLGAASELLAGSVDMPSTLAGITRLAVGGVVEGSSIFLVEDGALVRAAHAHADPELEELLGRTTDRYEITSMSPYPLVRAFRRGEPELLSVLPERFAERLPSDEHDREIRRRLGTRSAILVPLVARDRKLGMLTLWASQPGRLGEEELAVAVELSRRAAVALDRSSLYAEAYETAALLQGVLTQMPSGLAIAGVATGRLLLHNDRAEAIWRRRWTETTLAEHGARARGFHGDGRPYEPHEWPLVRAAEHGETVTAEEIEIERGDGTRGVIEVSAAAVRDESGEIVAGVEIFDDVTARHDAEARLRESEERQHFLADASAVLASSLDVRSTLDAVARHAVTRIADWCSIVLRADGGTLETFAAAHADPRKGEWVRELQERALRDVDGAHGVAAVMRSGEHELIHDTGAARSSLVVPLTTRERTIGAMTLATARDSGRRLGPDDLELAQLVAKRAAIAVDNALLYAEAEFQRALLERQGEASVDGLLVVGADRSILSVNERFREIWRIPDDVLARGDEAALAAAIDQVEAPEAFVARVRELYDRREASREDLHLRDGRTIERYGSPVIGPDGAYLGYLWSFRDISDRIEVEQRLREAQALLRSAISAAAIGTWVWDVAPDRLVADEFVAQVFALDPVLAAAGAQLDAYLAAVHDEDVADVRAAIRRAAEAGEELSADFRVRDADGELHWVHARGRVEPAPEGSPVRLAGAVAEITERRLAAERLEFLAGASDVLAGTLDYRETLRAVAQLAVPMLGDFCFFDLEDEETGELERVASAHVSPQGQRLLDRAAAVVPPRDAEHHPVAIAMRTGKPVLAADVDAEWMERAATSPAHLQLLRDFGTRSVLSVPLLVGRRPVGALTFGFAESGRRHRLADQTLGVELARRAALAMETARLYAETEARARAAQALEFVRDGVFLLDADGRIALWNPAAAAITGIRGEDVVGRHAEEALADWPLDRLGDRTETHPVEVDGRELWLSLSAVAFEEGTVYAFRDLTEEHAVERLKTDFVSTVSHELRTPLAAIYGAAMTLQRTDVALAEDQRVGLLGVVANESERLARIVNDVLWASRLDAGVLAVSIESCDPAALASAVVSAARVHLPVNVDLGLTLEPGLPPVAADPDKVRQVLVNLVDNAIKYSPDGGLVEVRVESAEHVVRFSVLDRGLGIPPSEHSRIFEKFFRLDPNLTRGVGGTGLGLYICRELVRRMDGRIWVESTEGAGSTFAFELPVAGR